MHNIGIRPHKFLKKKTKKTMSLDQLGYRFLMSCLNLFPCSPLAPNLEKYVPKMSRSVRLGLSAAYSCAHMCPFEYSQVCSTLQLDWQRLLVCHGSGPAPQHNNGTQILESHRLPTAPAQLLQTWLVYLIHTHTEGWQGCVMGWGRKHVGAWELSASFGFIATLFFGSQEGRRDRERVKERVQVRAVPSGGCMINCSNNIM